jgi:hypothetical protein
MTAMETYYSDPDASSSWKSGNARVHEYGKYPSIRSFMVPTFRTLLISKRKKMYTKKFNSVCWKLF